MSITAARFLRPAAFLVLVTTAALVTGAATPARARHDDVRMHTALTKAVPAKDSTVSASPEMLQLWFNQKIELSLSKVQLVDAKQQPIPLSAISRDDSKKDSPVVAHLMVEIPDGAYVVNWTAASADGHAVRGSFRFYVKTK